MTLTLSRSRGLTLTLLLTPLPLPNPGTWYSDDQEFDHELITHLRNAAIGLVQREVQATVAQVLRLPGSLGLTRGLTATSASQ